jgi:hypothetical protein
MCTETVPDSGYEKAQATELVCPPCDCYPSTGDTVDTTDSVSSLLFVSALFKRGIGT